MSIDNVNLRCKYNAVGVKYVSNRSSTRLRGLDMLDKSRQYRASVNIASTYRKTEYVKYNGKIVKLASMIAQLRHAHLQWYVSTDRKYITTNENGKTTYRITITNGCMVKHNTLDKKQQKRIYQGK